MNSVKHSSFFVSAPFEKKIIFYHCFIIFCAVIFSAVSAQQPSGEPMPVGNLPGWRQIFADDFNTAVAIGAFPDAVSTKWNAYPDPWHDTSKNGTYAPHKVISIHDGVMDLYIHTENGVHLVSAPEPNLPGTVGSEGGLLYGRYAVRFKSDPIPNYKTAWLLWPDSETWPGDGEIDYPEGNLSKTISAYMHRQNGTSGIDRDAYETKTTYNSWHTAVIEWLPDKCTFILDDKVIGSSTSRIPNSPMHWVLQTETALDGVAPSNSDSGHVLIDWVAVYAYTPSTEVAPAATHVAVERKRSSPAAVYNLEGRLLGTIHASSAIQSSMLKNFRHGTACVVVPSATRIPSVLMVP